MVILNNFWIIRKTILQFILVVYIGFSDYILGLSWYSDQDRSIQKSIIWTLTGQFWNNFHSKSRVFDGDFHVQDQEFHGRFSSSKDRSRSGPFKNWYLTGKICIKTPDHGSTKCSWSFRFESARKYFALGTFIPRAAQNSVLGSFFRESERKIIRYR